MTNQFTDQPTEARKCSNPACPLRRAHSGPCPPSDWKPAAPSKAQVEAACKAHEFTNAFGPERETRMRAALVAAAGVAPPAPSEHEYMLKARSLHQTNSGLPSSAAKLDAGYPRKEPP